MSLTSKVKILKNNIRIQEEQTESLQEILEDALKDAREGDIIRVNEMKMKHLMEFFSKNFGLRLMQMGCKNKA